MKKSKVIAIILLCMIGIIGCGKNKANNETNARYSDNKNIDISQINSNEIIYNYKNADMNVYNPDIKELSEEAEIIIKGNLTEIDSYLDENTMSMKSNYTFKVNETYKGNADKEITINMVGGIMQYSDYAEQVKEFGGKINTEENQGKNYIVFGLCGFNPLVLNKEYVIYVNYNMDTEMFYPLYYFYGIYEKNEEGLYERFGVDENDKQTVDLDEIIKQAK